MTFDALRPRPVPISLASLTSLAESTGVSSYRGVDADDEAHADVPITGIELDSRLVRPGDLFAALPGRQVHGAQFVDDALQRGAVAVLTDPLGRAAIPDGVPVRVVADPRAVLGPVAAEVYRLRPGDDLRQRLTLVGVTGTNGKTTVTHLVHAGLSAAGIRAGVIGTVGVRVGDDRWSAVRTTPEAVHLVALLAAMAESGVTAVAMEVSSHALSERRVDGVCIDVAGFTNLSQDHLDYHGTMEAYFAAKASLFTPQRARQGVVCIDDDWGRRLLATAGIEVDSASITDSTADWFGKMTEGTFTVRGPHSSPTALHIPMLGSFNRANALLAWALLGHLPVPKTAAAQGIAGASVPGRMEFVTPIGPIRGIVDYAHTPQAIERAVGAVRESVRAPGRVIVVLGAGGDRDPDKRVAMGIAAASLADHVIVTDDNPRTEDPAVIRAALLEGVRSVPTVDVLDIADRREAIAQAVRLAVPGDVVVVLGKGHETGIEIMGRIEPFDDRAELSAALGGQP